MSSTVEQFVIPSCGPHDPLESMKIRILWTAGGNNKLLYCGAQDQSVYHVDQLFTDGCLFVGVKVASCRYYTYTMFEVCALWIVKLIQGEMSALPDKVPG